VFTTSGPKRFLKLKKNGLVRAVFRDATSEEAGELKQQNADLKKAAAELVLEVQRYKKSRHVSEGGMKG